MTTPRDLLIVTMGTAADHPAEKGDLSLALAGAEAIDLLGTRTIRLDGDLIVPDDDRPAPTDPLMAEAASSIVQEEPYESVTDWLWRRGRGLSAVYEAALEQEGLLARQRRRGLSFRVGTPELVESPARRRAVDRWRSEDPVLANLAETVGVRGDRTEDIPDVADDAVATVLAAISDAVVELASVRQRRAIDEAAFDNIWRGGV
ncbi:MULTISPECIES: GPP34 family phosphoprotein [unclassified Streptomyces]|uniref:GOLPH3/VPS74 family protein n=1 Tax=unclassified Streptomyces TaxID=2593676 RepID=UPI0029B7A2FE|nr:GPP34 family phosphoprotein [Streptomyces sp. DK15]MDX2395639.1 GPP34 family phosphoprotein [Streptomyces sp. DK15]